MLEVGSCYHFRVDIIWIVGVIVAVVGVLAALTLRRVPIAERHVVNRLGRIDRTLAPGWHLIVPFVERVGHRVSMGGRMIETKMPGVTTADGERADVDGLIYFQVLDATKAAERLDTLNEAARALTETGTRSLVAEMTANSLRQRSARDINDWLVGMLNQSAESWGVRITRVDLSFHFPPRT